MEIKKYFRIDPYKNFIELPILWIVIVILVSVAGTITFFIVSNSTLEISFDYKGFNFFVEVFKVPLAILAIIVTFAAFLATTHRSSQIREQLISAQKQNTFSNYFKHIEEFEKYISSLKLNKSFDFQNLRLTHKHLFPNSIDGNYSVNEDFLDIIEIECSKCVSLLKNFNRDEEKSFFQIFLEIYSSLDKTYSFLNIKIKRSGRQIVENGKKIIVPDFEIRSAFTDIKNSLSQLELILSFDHSISIPRSLKKISQIDVEAVPDISFEAVNELIQFDVFSDKEM